MIALPASPPTEVRATRLPWRPAAYPIVIGTAFFALLFLSSGASPFSGIRMILAAVLVSTIVAVACCLLMRDRDRGSLLAMLVLIGLYAGPGDPRLLALLALAALLVVVESVMSRRRPMKMPWPLISRVGNAIAVIVVLAIGIKTFQDGTFQAIAADIQAEGPSVLRPADQAHAASADPADPDIYVILLDGYARADKQQALFGHDDGPFVQALEARGFDVATRNRSNYLITAVSLASTLNMRHLQDETELASLPVNDIRHVRQARHLINDNAVFAFLRGRGYGIDAVSSGFEEVALRQADRFIDTGQLSEVELLTFRHTGVGPIATVLAPDIFADQQRARIDAVFDAGAELAREPHDRPSFAFIHVPSPHAPVVFDGSGGPVEARDLPSFYEDSAIGRGISRETYGHGYTGQVDYLNGRTIDLVDKILASSTRPPVILVMSDHGSASGFDFGDSTGSDVDERSANFFAALTPGRSDVFEDDGTLVNVFGRLFQSYFDRPHQDLPDAVYGWRGQSIFDTVPIDPSRLEP